eukprot:2920690-Pyramimonas_sp.AAC.1
MGGERSSSTVVSRLERGRCPSLPNKTGAGGSQCSRTRAHRHPACHIITLRAILRRLGVSPSSFIHSRVYAKVYNTCMTSLCLMIVHQINQPCNHDGICFGSPFRPLRALAVPIKLMFCVLRKCPRNLAGAFPQIGGNSRVGGYHL